MFSSIILTYKQIGFIVEKHIFWNFISKLFVMDGCNLIVGGEERGERR
jgi:hypothetical protein